MTGVISANEDHPRLVAPVYPSGRSAARRLLVLTPGGGREARSADAAAMRSKWHLIQRDLVRFEMSTSEGPQLRTKFYEFCDDAAAARLRSARLAVAVSGFGAIISAVSSVSVAFLAFGDNRLWVLLAYMATCSALSLPLVWAMKRRSRRAMVVSALTVAAAGWWATGASYPPRAHSTLTLLAGNGEDATVGIALGAALIGLLILVAAVLAAASALIRHDHDRFRRPDLRAFDELLQAIVSLTCMISGGLLDRAGRLAIADNLAAARRAVRRISAATGRHGSRQDRRKMRRGLRRWAKRFRAGTGVLWTTKEDADKTLRICLESMIPLLTGYYGDLDRAARADVPITDDQSRWAPKWLRRLSGAAVPPAVLVAAHVGGVPVSSPAGIAIAFFAIFTLLLVVAGANDTHPTVVLLELFRLIRKHGRQRMESKEHSGSTRLTESD
jgi:hypothetical protein